MKTLMLILRSTATGAILVTTFLVSLSSLNFLTTLSHFTRRTVTLLLMIMAKMSALFQISLLKSQLQIWVLTFCVVPTLPMT